jgi:hypothetical protein
MTREEVSFLPIFERHYYGVALDLTSGRSLFTHDPGLSAGCNFGSAFKGHFEKSLSLGEKEDSSRK